ncbi:MAG TPA: HAD-IC family P-type ATPase [Candidatus Binatia bacterium]|nr:HAD-IC family P-type ATPase [Candidatus Binatia bacterium]
MRAASSPVPSVVAVSIAVRGRARLRVTAVRGRPALAARLADRVGSEMAVHDVQANPVTGSLLVRFDPARASARGVITLVRRHLRGLDHGGNGHESAAEAWHLLPASDVLERLATSAPAGLTSEEAAGRLSVVGANRLPVPQPKSPLAIIGGHLSSLPVLLLGGAAVLSIASGAAIEAAVILAVVAANATVGFVTERRVERILTSLQSTTTPHALVRRDNRELSLPAGAVVPGDVLVLKAGHDVPADARVIAVHGLSVDESALTGESVPAAKVASVPATMNGALADRINMVHAGTVVAEGAGLAVVTATGRNTELGRIRALVAEASMPPTPLEQQLDRTGRRLVGLSLGACAAALGLGLLRGVPLLEMARSAISLAVAAVPEGLPAVATTTLALGTQRMLGRGTLVRRLGAVESLGAVTVICADKTGTLTENRMTVDSWCVGRREYGQGDELAAERAVDPALAWALRIAVLCNEAALDDDGGEGVGSSTETALLRAAATTGVDYRTERQRHPLSRIRRREDGDSWMATVHAAPDGELVMVKGAPEQVLARADRWLEDGVEQPLTESARKERRRLNDRIAERGLRVLGLAFRTLDGEAAAPYEGLVWVGVVALTDPIRPGVGHAIRACRTAGIRTVLLTGDHARTAAAIYRGLALGNGAPQVLDASHVGELSPDRLTSLVEKVDVFARVSPADKYRIVRALQARGEVVAMTGDGINDAAALRAADIGVAMGDRGTDVARDVADVVLLTDDFGGIVAAVAQGRTIHTNISKSLRFLLATNFSEILVTLGALAAGVPRPMSAIQFLWINLLSDVAPALALAVEPAERDVMARPPRDPGAPMLSKSTLLGIAGDAGVLAATTLGVHALALARYGAGPRATTLAFSTLTSAQLLHALTYRARADRAEPAAGCSVLPAVVGGTLAVQLAAMALPPLRRLLGLTPLAAIDWALVAGATALPFVLKEIRRQGDDHGTSRQQGPA